MKVRKTQYIAKQYQLSKQDIEMLVLLAKGRSNKQIGERFGRSGRTIEKYFGTSHEGLSIYNKIGVSNRKEAIAWTVSNLGWNLEAEQQHTTAQLNEDIKSTVSRLLPENRHPASVLAAQFEAREDELEAFFTGRKSIEELSRPTILRLLQLFSVVRKHPHVATVPEAIKLASNMLISPIEIASRFLSEGLEISVDSWAEALPYFQIGEKLFGPSSSQAAFAALEGARMLLYLGLYDVAISEVLRVQREFVGIMDPGTLAKARLMQGWINYNRGHYQSAERSLLEQVRISKEAGNEALGFDSIGNGGHHFIARIYMDQALLSTNKAQKENYLDQALLSFNQSLQISRRMQADIIIGYEYLRLAQLMREKGDWVSARRSRIIAARLFGELPHKLHIDLENARIAINEGNLKQAAKIAEGVLDQRSGMHYAKGIADALKVMGRVARVKGNLNLAAEHYSAAFSIYPHEESVSNRLLWPEFKEIFSELVSTQYKGNFQRFVRETADRVKSRKGSFRYLKFVLEDSEVASRRFLNKLNLAMPLDGKIN